MKEKIIENFSRGLVNKIEAKSIGRGATSSVLNWLPFGDKIELRRGTFLVGTEQKGTGKITGLYTAKDALGVEVTYRTRGKMIEYYDTVTEDWIEVGTNQLGTAADGEDVSFAEYVTNHGNQLWISSPNSSLFKIMTANPGSITDMYFAANNYKGKIQIQLNRMFLWGRVKDKTGIYGSYIDILNNTTVTDESIGTGDGTAKTFTGTLAFKAGGSRRTCFAIAANDVDSVEVFTDNYAGTLTGSLGGTGTINYTTGAISIAFITAPTLGKDIRATYQWEDSVNNGIADFTYSSTRLAGEGIVFRQDVGGNMQNIMTYADIQYCLHEFNTWRLNIGADDTDATNRVYRELAGIPNWKAAVATGGGIYFVDDSNVNDPKFRILRVEEGSTEVIPIDVSIDLSLSDYRFDTAVSYEYGDYIIMACRTSSNTINDRLFVYNKIWKNWTILDYRVSCFAINNGELWAGDSGSDNVYKLFSGVDDDDSVIINSWASNLDNLDYERLKKVKRLVIQGDIQVDQDIVIYFAFDNGSFIEVGAINGDGNYVDRGNPISVGSTTTGSKVVGAGDVILAYNYEKEIKIRTDKFEKVKIKFVATGIGYASVSKINYKDIRVKEQRVPSKYRE